MPGNKKYAKRKAPGKKAWKGKRRGGYKMVNLVGKSLNPIPQRTILKMKYADNFELNAGNAYSYQFNLNSIFDPNRTGTGHQPYGHDQMALLYNRYRVINCSYSVVLTTGTTVVKYVCVPGNEVQIFNSVDEARENPRAKFSIQTPNGRLSPIHGNVYIPSLTGRNKSQYMADDRYQAVVGASPAELAILNIQAAAMNESALTAPAAIILEYTVEFFDAKTLAQS